MRYHQKANARGYTHVFEELYALAILYSSGFDTGDAFQNLLNKMTLQGSEDILDLQFMPLKDAVIHTLFMADHGTKYDPDIFGRYLMHSLQDQWRSMPLHDLVANLYNLWRNLPESLQYQMPFELFIYADDEAGFCKEAIITEAQCRSWFEAVFNYYENGKRMIVGTDLVSQLDPAKKPPVPPHSPEHSHS